MPKAYTLVAKDDWVAREAKGTWCVVLCSPKDYAATESAHRSRLQCSSLVEQLPVKESAVGSNPTIDKKAKTDSVVCEKHLILDQQWNQVRRNSQGEICLCQKFRKWLAPLNGSQDQRSRKRRIAYSVKTTACLKTAMLIADYDTSLSKVLVDVRRKLTRKVDNNVWGVIVKGVISTL